MANILNLKQIAQKLLTIYPDLNQAQQVASWLLEKLTGKSGAQILLEQDLSLTSEQESLLVHWLEQMIVAHQPVQYILGSVPFLNLDILVESPILIPRPETEYWLDLLLSDLKNFKNHDLKILDLCSGSGCIGLSLAKNFPNSQVVAVDISRQACDLIAKNKKHNLVENLEVVCGDLFASLAGQKFDLIVSNPPYIPAQDYQNLDLSVRLWEDRLALVAPGFDLSIITKIIAQAPDFLQLRYASLPRLWLEIDATQGLPVVALMQEKFGQVELVQDQFGRQRVVLGR